MSAAQQQADSVMYHDRITARMRDVLRDARRSGLWGGGDTSATDVLAEAGQFTITEIIEFGPDAAAQARRVPCS